MRDEPMDLQFRSELLRTFRSVMPGVAGVVLTAPDGAVRGHDVGDSDRAEWLAQSAVLGAGESALVPHADRLYLVVRVPEA